MHRVVLLAKSVVSKEDRVTVEVEVAVGLQDVFPLGAITPWKLVPGQVRGGVVHCVQVVVQVKQTHDRARTDDHAPVTGLPCGAVLEKRTQQRQGKSRIYEQRK